MRKVTNSTVIGAYSGLQEFKKIFSVKAPAKLLVAISMHEDEISKHTKNYDKARIALCEKLCEKDEDNNPVMIVLNDGASQYKFTVEAQQAFEKEWDDLKAMEVDVPSYQLTVEDIKDFAVEPAMMPNFAGFLKYFVGMPE